MNFKTTLEAKASNLRIAYQDNILFLGSCFSENIGKALQYQKFNAQINPFGIMYNPVSIFNTIENIAKQKTYTAKDFIQSNELWSSFDFHSSIAADSSSSLEQMIASKMKESFLFLKQSKVLFLTFGTAWVYKTQSTQQVVANCHKFPATHFTKSLLEIDDILNAYKKTHSILKSINPELNIVLTISPVRHLRDGFIENNQSKATLHLFVKKVMEQFEHTFYFPAYEYVLDDLRDYRFFGQDMLHPNELAIQYVLEKFYDTFFTEETKVNAKRIKKVLKSLEHKVQNKESESYKSFKQNLFNQMAQLEKEGFCFKKERSKFDV